MSARHKLSAVHEIPLYTKKVRFIKRLNSLFELKVERKLSTEESKELDALYNWYISYGRDF